MHIVFFGLSLTSSWGNGHATTYRGLLAGLRQLGHELDFFERDAPWYAQHRDLARPPQARLHLYRDWNEVHEDAAALCRSADAVIVGSYFPDAIAVLDDLLGRSGPAVCFYDIDTPITLQALREDRCAYLRREQIPALDLYLSFTGGPMLDELRQLWGAQHTQTLYCACDVSDYTGAVRPAAPAYDLSFLGTFAPDRESKLRRLLLEPARQLPQMRFAVAGSMYPTAAWPANVHYISHLAPNRHRAFYADSRFTLNLTRQAMVEAGYSPSIRLFEAAAGATPVITDPWPGLGTFFHPETEILVASNTHTIVEILLHTSTARSTALGCAAQQRVLAQHTGSHRARELECALASLRSSRMAAKLIPVATGM